MYMCVYRKVDDELSVHVFFFFISNQVAKSLTLKMF